MKKHRGEVTFKSSKVHWVVIDFCLEEPSRLARMFVVTLVLLFPTFFLLSAFIKVPKGSLARGTFASPPLVPLRSEVDIDEIQILAKKNQYLQSGDIFASQLKIPSERGPTSFDNSALRTTSSGLVKEILVRDRQKIRRGDLIAWILPTEATENVEVFVAPPVFETLTIGENVEVSYFVKGHLESFEGHIVTVEPSLDEQSGNIRTEKKVIIRVASESSPPVWVGEEVKVRFKPGSESLFSAVSRRILQAD